MKTKGVGTHLSLLRDERCLCLIIYRSDNSGGIVENLVLINRRDGEHLQRLVVRITSGNLRITSAYAWVPRILVLYDALG